MLDDVGRLQAIKQAMLFWILCQPRRNVFVVPTEQIGNAAIFDPEFLSVLNTVQEINAGRDCRTTVRIDGASEIKCGSQEVAIAALALSQSPADVGQSFRDVLATE